MDRNKYNGRRKADQGKMRNTTTNSRCREWKWESLIYCLFIKTIHLFPGKIHRHARIQREHGVHIFQYALLTGLLFFPGGCFLINALMAQAKYEWTASSGSWTDAANWNPLRISPHAEDTLVWNEGTFTVMQPPAEETISTLLFRPGALVTFDAATPASLHINGQDTCFRASATSVLTLKGTGGLQFAIGNGSTVVIYGEINCSGGPQRLLPGTAASIYFKKGSLFRAGTGFSGNPFGTAALNSVIFEEDATYISIAGSNPFGATAPKSVVVFKAGSVYRHQRATAPQFSGRVYGNFEVAALVSYNTSLTQDAIIQNDLRISLGQFMFRPLGGSGNLVIRGNIVRNTTGNLELGRETWQGRVILEGPAPHDFISVPGAPPFLIHKLSLTGAALRLQCPLEIMEKCFQENGIIYSTDTSVLVLKEKAVLSYNSSAYPELPYAPMGNHTAYIDGPLRIENLEDTASYVFPTGAEGRCRPVIVHLTNGDVQVQYFKKSPLTISPFFSTDSLLVLNQKEYWKIEGLEDGSRVELSFIAPELGWAPLFSFLRVCKSEENNWVNIGNEAVAGTETLYGSVRSGPVKSGFFTTGSIHNSPVLSLSVTGNLPGDNNVAPPANDSPLLIYPNPAREKIFIFFKNLSSKTEIRLVSINGGVLLRTETGQRLVQLNIHHLPPGIYFLHLRNKNTNRILPFVKQ